MIRRAEPEALRYDFLNISETLLVAKLRLTDRDDPQVCLLRI
jgi:hypothetical protein